MIMGRMISLLLLTALLAQATIRLYLKDGTHHTVSEYQVLKDRVRYYSTERGDYTASFRPNHDRPDHDGFVLTMTPKQMDPEHRSFYADQDGVIHGDDQKAADGDSPKVK